MKIDKLILSALVMVFALNIAPSVAYEKGDVILRAGVANVNPDDNDNAVKIGGDRTDLTVSVDDDTQLGLTGTYMLSDHLGLGLLASTPFKHTVSLDNAGTLNGDIVDAKHLPPTLTLQYYFNSPSSVFQPYVGVGVNYTYFFDEEAKSSALKSAANTRNVKIDDSFGLALEAGFDYMINSNWVFNATVWYIDLDTDAKITSDLGEITADVSIDPFVYMLGFGYKF